MVNRVCECFQGSDSSHSEGFIKACPYPVFQLSPRFVLRLKRRQTIFLPRAIYFQFFKLRYIFIFISGFLRSRLIAVDALWYHIFRQKYTQSGDWDGMQMNIRRSEEANESCWIVISSVVTTFWCLWHL